MKGSDKVGKSIKTINTVQFPKVCKSCKREETISLTKNSYKRYKNGEKILNMFSELNENERNLLVNGMCSKCTDIQFSLHLYKSYGLVI